MSGINFFIIGFVIILGLAVWNWRHTQENRQSLVQAGFNIDERFGGSPELVMDTRRKELALISGKGYERIPLTELLSAELASDSLREADTHFRIELHLRDERLIKVNYSDEWAAKKALNQLHSATGI